MANKKLKVDKDVLDGLMFGAWRYYIGRHTIAAAHTPGELTGMIESNKGAFSDNRLRFMGADVLRECNDTLRWNNGVSIQGSQDVCALNIMVEAIIKHYAGRKIDLDELKHSSIVIDLDNPELTRITDFSRENGFDLYELIADLTPWIQFAGYLRPTHIITFGNEPEFPIQSLPGFAYPSLYKLEGDPDWHLELHYQPVENYTKNPFRNSYISPEYIKNIEKI